MEKLSELEDVAAFLSLILLRHNSQSHGAMLLNANHAADAMNRISDEAKREVIQFSIKLRQSFLEPQLLIIEDED